MIETTRLPEEFIAGIGETRYPFGPKVEKRTLAGIDEIQYRKRSTKRRIETF